MLRVDKVQLIEGVTVYGDDKQVNKFYLLPELPRYRRDDNGSPIFKFLKYRMPLDHGEGKKKGGGYVFFDVEFVVPEEKLQKIKDELQTQVNKIYKGRTDKKVEIGTITYTKGEASLLLEADGELIEKVKSPGKPSLYGRNVTPFALELSPEGATLFWEALQGQGGVVQVVYDLYYQAALPPVEIRGGFSAEKFYDFYQTIDTEWNAWGEDSYQEEIRETFRSSESLWVKPDWGALTDTKMQTQLRDWAFRTVEDKAESMMIEAIAPVSEEGRKKPSGIEDVTRDISVKKISSFSLYFKENMAVEWFAGPRGSLPNITNLVDNQGNAIKWEDHAKEVDLDDPFFKSMHVDVFVNADFANLPINSIEAQLEYKEGNEHEIKEFRFTDAETVGKFSSFIENDKREYSFWYEVNYANESRTFKSEPEVTDEQVLTLNVGDLGVLSINIEKGDLNFEQVSSAQITIQYKDDDNGIEPIEWHVTLDENNDKHKKQKVIFGRQRKPYKYKVKYNMKDGREYESDWSSSRSSELYINDPFSASKSIGLRTIGDFENDIEEINVDLVYKDTANDYWQSHTMALNKDTRFYDWVFPVINEKEGVVEYSGIIRFKGGRSEDIEKTTTAESTITLGVRFEKMLEVKVIPSLVKFTEVALAQVQLRYQDTENGVDEGTDLIFDSSNGKVPQAWSIALKDKDKKTYSWQATFHMLDGTVREVAAQETDALSLILKLPTA